MANPLPNKRRRTTAESWTLNENQGRYLRVVTANVARDVLAEEQARGRFPVERDGYNTLVDHNPAKPVTQVRFGGRIEYIRKRQAQEVITWIYQQLYKLSPVGPPKGSGRAAFRRRHYSESHLVLANNQVLVGVNQRTGALRLLEQVGGSDRSVTRVQFTNVQPYARRIEKGKGTQFIRRRDLPSLIESHGKHKDARRRIFRWSVQAPGGVYEKVFRLARTRFRGQARISLRYVQLQGLGYQFYHGGAAINQFYPVITVEPLLGGEL